MKLAHLYGLAGAVAALALFLIVLVPAHSAASGSGTLLVMASSADGGADAPGSLQLVGSGGTVNVAAASGPVPRAPATRELARLTLAPGAFTAIRIGQRTYPARIVVSRGQVEPVLIGVGGADVLAGGVWAGNDDFNLGLSELAGQMIRLEDFDLRDQAGRPFNLAAIGGHDTIVAAFHTSCRETCPIYTGLLLQLRKKVAASVRLVEVSTDPADTPPELAAYARQVGADWTFATGDGAALAAFWSQFGVPLSGLDEHASTLAVIDAHGFLRVVYRGVPDVGGSLPPQLDSRLSAAGRAQLRSPGGWGQAQILDALETIGRAGRDQPDYGPARKARDFTLDSFSGSPVSLSQFRGRPVVINFFASWCGPCRAELPLLEREAAAHPELSFILVDVLDQQAPARDLLARLQVRTPTVLSDPDGSVSNAYGAPGLPTTVFVRADGTIAATVSRQLDAATLGSRLALVMAG